MVMQLPGGYTLAQTRRAFFGSEAEMAIDAITSRSGRYPRMRFLDENRKEFPDSMLLRDFRTLANAGKATISIDDEGGGTPAKQPVEPPLQDA